MLINISQVNERMNEEEKKEWKKGKLMSEGLNRKAQLIQIKHTL